MSDLETTNESMSDMPMAETRNSGMGMRLGIILGMFVILAGGILGYQYYLKSQLPVADPNFIKAPLDENTDMGTSNGAMPQAPPA